jgi:probable phosphoglycerate mutase
MSEHRDGVHPAPRRSRIIMVRHGETKWNAEMRIQGHQDSPLTAVGLRQAEAVAARLAREKLDAIYASDLGRVRQTVEPLIKVTGLVPKYDAALRERNYGEFEGKTLEELDVEFPGQFAKLRTGNPHGVPPGGESLAQFHARIAEALEGIAQEAAGKTVAVMVHGGVCGELFRHAMRIPLEAPRTFSLFNASINRWSYKRGLWHLDVWGDVTHLPAESRDDT